MPDPREVLEKLKIKPDDHPLPPPPDPAVAIGGKKKPVDPLGGLGIHRGGVGPGQHPLGWEQNPESATATSPGPGGSTRALIESLTIKPKEPEPPPCNTWTSQLFAWWQQLPDETRDLFQTRISAGGSLLDPKRCVELEEIAFPCQAIDEFKKALGSMPGDLKNALDSTADAAKAAAKAIDSGLVDALGPTAESVGSVVGPAAAVLKRVFSEQEDACWVRVRIEPSHYKEDDPTTPLRKKLKLSVTIVVPF